MGVFRVRMARALEELKQRFPGSLIITLPESEPEPLEIVCELLNKKDERQSEVIAVIERSHPHLHRQTTEVYIVEDGYAIVSIDGEERGYGPGDVVVIRPNEIHSVRGEAVRLRVIASPPWTPEDHILVGE